MSFKPNLKINEIITNVELTKLFKCGNSGGMRRSHKTNTLVIVSDYTKNFYSDVYHGGVLKYTGMGKTGNQSLEYMQNKTLKESDSNGVSVHWFEVYVKNEYLYKGRVKLVDKPTLEKQKDLNGNERDVWVFPLAVVEDLTEIDISQEFMLGEMQKLNENEIIEIVTIEEGEFPVAKKTRKKTNKNNPIKRDYVKEAKRKSKIGILGEYMILSFEKERLMQLGREDLAKQITHVSLDDDSAGFDIISFEVDSDGNATKKFIEVKTTTANEINSFYLSKNEFEVMNDLKDKYWIYRVYDVETEKPKFYKASYEDLYNKYKYIPQSYLVEFISHEE